MSPAICTHTHTHTHTDRHAHIHTHTDTDRHTHTQTPKRSCIEERQTQKGNYVEIEEKSLLL